MNNKIKKNYIYNLIYQILTIITPFITTPYVSRTLCADGVGTSSYLSALVSYFVLFGGLGLTTYGQREISYCHNSKIDRSVKFWEIQILGFCSYGISLLVYILFVFFFHQNDLLYVIVCLQILASMFDTVWFFYGIEDFKNVVVRNIILKLLSIILVFAFVKNENDLSVYMLICLGVNFISSLCLWPLLTNRIAIVPINLLRPFKHIKGALQLFVPTIAIQVYVNVDKIMIGFFANGSAQNGYYEQAQKIESMCLMVVVSLGTVMIPRIGALFSENNITEVERMIYKSFRFTFITSLPICFGLIAISDIFVKWFFGNGFEEVISILCVLSINIILIGLSNVIGTQYLIPLKKQKEYTISVILGMIINIIMNAILIEKYLALGASVATLCAELVVTSTQFLMVKDRFNIKIILVENWKYFVASFIMFSMTIVIKNEFCLIGDGGLVGVCVLTGLVVYVIALCILKDDFFLELSSEVIKRIKT